LKGWKFLLEKVVQLLEHMINYWQAQPKPNFGNDMNDGMDMEEEKEMHENIMPNGKEIGKW
jgi:hypothetical protein